MPLPTPVVPYYDLTLPSTGQAIKFRPFLVKEEKLLLLAMESKDSMQIANAMKAVISGCIKAKNVKVEKLPTFDIEYLFLNIRAKAVGEEVELKVYCPDDGETEVMVKIDLETVEVKKFPEHTNKIDLGSDMTLILQYPTLDYFIRNNFEIAESLETDTVKYDQSLDLFIECIDSLIDKDEVYVQTDYSKEEWIDFLESLDEKKFNNVRQFFDTMPKLMHEIDVTNPKTKVTKKVTLEGLTSFFTSE
jgi:hypothetical protein